MGESMRCVGFVVVGLVVLPFMAIMAACFDPVNQEEVS